jgi:signal recognition particle protein
VYAATEEIVEVKSLKGIRLRRRTPEEEEQNARPKVEYLVEWEDGSPDTWEPVTNLADNLLRDFEQRWWGAVKKGDEATINAMLDGGGAVLSRTLNEERRSALHFAAALGRAELVRRLIREGAEVDLGDQEGYTPLHMASGYLHTSTIYALLDGGADPEQQDRQGRSPLELVESLRDALPAGNPATAARRLALEDVLKVLVDNLYEDVEPEAVLDIREEENEEEGETKAGTEYLVKFSDEEDPVWIAEKYMSEEVISDFNEGLEYSQAKEIIDRRNKGDSRAYLVRWMDGYPDSWEPEEHVSQDLIYMFENNGALPEGTTDSQSSS